MASFLSVVGPSHVSIFFLFISYCYFSLFFTCVCVGGRGWYSFNSLYFVFLHWSLWVKSCSFVSVMCSRTPLVQSSTVTLSLEASGLSRSWMPCFIYWELNMIMVHIMSWLVCSFSTVILAHRPMFTLWIFFYVSVGNSVGPHMILCFFSFSRKSSPSQAKR